MTTSNPYRTQYIHFPRSWNEKWLNEGVTDLDKAKVILYDFIRMDKSGTQNTSLCSPLWTVLRYSEVPGRFENVAQLATVIQTKVFWNQHTRLSERELLQRMRFILLKCYSNLPQTRETDRLRNFFFDPAVPLHPGNIIRPNDTTVLEVPPSMLKIVIIGGGPTGLSAAINLAERVRCRDLVQIHVFDKRWKNKTIGELEFTGYPEYQRRRDQVVTLQDHVMNLLSEDTKRVLKFGLCKRGFERVWPDSSNLQISMIEDSLLKRAQDSVFDGIIHLHNADVTDEETLVDKAGGDIHLLLGTDGANSWVRKRYFFRDQEQCGRSFALGVALDRGNKGLPRLQPLNVLLTLCQMRFLLNASDRYGTGYLNMLLTEQEYDECVLVKKIPAEGASVKKTPADFGSPACIRKSGTLPAGCKEEQVFAPYHENSTLWRSISDGLRLFGFKETDVKNIVRIPINLIGVKTATKTVRLKSQKRRHDHCLVSLAGDSALTHHFWPGRGMNSGIKSAIAWSNQVSDLILERKEGLVDFRSAALGPYSDFMQKLREREHKDRSLVIQDAAGLPERMQEHIQQAHKLSEPNWKIDPELCERLLTFARRLENRGNWPHKKINDLSGMVMSILCRLDATTKAEMYYCGPWPTERMSMNGFEVIPPESLVRDPPRSKAAGGSPTAQNDANRQILLKPATQKNVSNQLKDSSLKKCQSGTPNTPTSPERDHPCWAALKLIGNVWGSILVWSILFYVLSYIAKFLE